MAIGFKQNPDGSWRSFRIGKSGASGAERKGMEAAPVTEIQAVRHSFAASDEKSKKTRKVGST